MKKLIIIIFTLFFLVAEGYSQSYKSNISDMTILYWNDFHARNTPYKVTKKDSTGNTVTYYIGGTSNMLGYIKKFRDKKTLLLNGGDDFQGSPISSITRGKSQINLLNLYNLNAFVLGNHEFDYGQYSLDSALLNVKFNYLSSNLYFKSRNRTFGKSYIIKKINKIKTGIIGVTTPGLMTLTVPKNVSDITILNTDSVIAVNIKKLKKKKCDLIVILSHCGVEYDRKIAEKFSKDVDIIIGGHSHTAIFKPEIVKGVIICQAGSYGRWLGKLDLQVNLQKDTVVKHFGKLNETVMDSAIYDRSAQEKVENMLASIQGELNRVIGTLDTDWKRGYGSESNIGQWQADAIRTKLNTDICFLNSGGIRKDLPAGDITVGDIWEIAPFGNTIVKFEVTGKTLKKMIENNIKLRMSDDGDGDVLVLSGIKITYDSQKLKESGNGFLISLFINGKDVTDSEIYTISTNNYVGSQFEKFFGNVSEDIKITDSNLIDRDIFIDAITEQKVINSVLEVRIVDISKQKDK